MTLTRLLKSSKIFNLKMVLTVFLVVTALIAFIDIVNSSMKSKN